MLLLMHTPCLLKWSTVSGTAFQQCLVNDVSAMVMGLRSVLDPCTKD